MQTLFQDDAGSVHLLEGDVGGRPLNLIYLKGKDASLLWDTGCAGDPERFIVPQIIEAGGDPTQLTWIINSHTDLDHQGGNYEMKQIAPRALLAAGDADQSAAESPEALLNIRYNHYIPDHGIGYDEQTRENILKQSGYHQPLDLTLVGGESLRMDQKHLGEAWSIEVVALPGHAKGHLGLYDSWHRALYGGDAIQGSNYLGLDGTPKLCPTYLHVDDYLNTIRFIEHLFIDQYVGCHWPVQTNLAHWNFCAESRNFVLRADQLMLQAVGEKPRTLRELCLHLGPQLGDWSHGKNGVDLELVFALEGHVSRGVERGWLKATRNAEGILVYELA